MHSPKNTAKFIGKALSGSMIAGVIASAINYALTPNEEKDMNVSLQFGLMTFGALFTAQATHFIYNQGATLRLAAPAT